jgi:predicted hotdog family 3-hydroxylacyl-ACP dehydratase
VQQIVFIPQVQEAGAGEKKQENENYIEFMVQAMVIHTGYVPNKEEMMRIPLSCGTRKSKACPEIADFFNPYTLFSAKIQTPFG